MFITVNAVVFGIDSCNDTTMDDFPHCSWQFHCYPGCPDLLNNVYNILPWILDRETYTEIAG